MTGSTRPFQRQDKEQGESDDDRTELLSFEDGFWLHTRSRKMSCELLAYPFPALVAAGTWLSLRWFK